MYQAMRKTLLTLLAVATLQAGNPTPPNQLTPEEKAAGWVLLFDGRTPHRWEGFDNTPFPSQSWAVEDGTIRTLRNNSGGDIVTVRPYRNFDLRFDWKLLKGGNSGLKYLVQKAWIGPGYRPDMPESWKQKARLRATGPEYQLLDDAELSGNPGSEYGGTGALYLLAAPTNKTLNPPGEWNSSRIVVRGVFGEHWLNGNRIATFEFNSKEMLDRVDQTKFKRIPGFGIKGPGYIALTHHNSPVWFRNIKLLDLDQ